MRKHNTTENTEVLMADSASPVERKTRGWASFLLDHVDR